MRRSEVWTVSAGIYAGKPRPAVILQADQFLRLGAITVIPFTSDPEDLSLVRLNVLPTPGNGLRIACRIMIDKVTTVPRRNLDARIGELSEEVMLGVSRAVAVFLGIA